MTEQKRSYWKPQPKPWDFIAVLLLASAAASSLGFILFVSQAFIGGADGNALWVRQVGGWLLAIGGEGGTLFATLEIFRKQQSESDRVTAWDWGGLVVSALATLSGLTLAYIPTVPITEGWLLWIQQRGALALLPMAVLDYYSTIMELGYRQASFGKRWESWNNARHVWEATRRTLADKKASETPAIATTPPPAATIADWRTILASMNGDERIESAADVQRLLTERSFGAAKPSTARRWAKMAQEKRQLAEF